MSSLSKAAGVVVGSTALAALPALTDAAFVNEFTVTGGDASNTFPGSTVGLGSPPNRAGLGDTFAGDVSGVTDSNAPRFDPIDFLRYTGLPAGGSYDFTVTREDCCDDVDNLMQAAIYTGQSTSGTPISLDFGETDHLLGIVPGSGALTLGIRMVDPGIFEGYRVILNVTRPAVPQPAALALLAAGLGALHVVRRRKR